MLFSSIPFLYYYLPIVLGLYFLAPWKLKNAVLLVSSLVFYGWGEQKLLGMDFVRPDTAASFEALYIHCLDHLKKAVKNMLERFEKYGKLWSKINPSPYLSSCMKNCIKNGKDYTAGGAKYNPHGIPFSGVAVYIDSLLAIKEICFEKKHTIISLQVLKTTVNSLTLF